jgi:hypothetical protein
MKTQYPSNLFPKTLKTFLLIKAVIAMINIRSNIACPVKPAKVPKALDVTEIP